MKKLLTTLLCLAALTLPARANAMLLDTFVIALPNGINIDVHGLGEADQFVVQNDSVVFTLSSRHEVDLSSADGYVLANDGGANVNCGINYSWVKIKVDAGQPPRVITVRPSLPKCAWSTGGVGNFVAGNLGFLGGGGGAPGSVNIPQTPSQPTQTTAQVPVAPTVALESPISVPIATNVSPIFKKVLSLGSSGLDVRRLQALLNADPDTRIATSGPGSLGQETGMFLRATKDALIRFQKKWGLASVGYLDSATRSKFTNIFSYIGQTINNPANTATLAKATTTTTISPTKQATTTSSAGSPVKPVKWWQFWRWFRR